MRIDILTLFPEMCNAILGESIIGRAQRDGKVQIVCHNIRDYADNKHNRVDDYPYGGGKGMVMQAEPICACFEAICAETGNRPLLLYMTPQGKRFTQQRAFELAALDHIAILCGHYEGVDERVIETLVDEELSIGDYVLTGGEIAAMAIADATIRLLDGVLADSECFMQESLTDGLLEYPQYTRPEEWRGQRVPDVLLSGHHAQIDQWRKQQSLSRTKNKRPDLCQK